MLSKKDRETNCAEKIMEVKGSLSRMCRSTSVGRRAKDIGTSSPKGHIMSFARLPTEVLLHILERLPLTSIIFSAQFVSRSFFESIHDPRFWPVISQKHYGRIVPPLSSRGAFSRQFHILRHLEQHRSFYSDGLIYICIREGLDEALVTLLRRDMHSNKSVYLGKLLLQAAKLNHKACVKALISYGAETNVKEEGTKRTPIFYAHDRETVYLLVQSASRSTTIYDSDGLSPIHVHALAGRLEPVKALLDGESVDLPSVHGDTPLHSACTAGHLSVVKFLVNVGARAIITNDAGRVPLHCAALNGYADVVDVLLERYPAKCGLNVIDKSGNTPLSLAASKGYDDISLKLLEKDGKLIPYKELDLLEAHKIGSGGFGEVFLVDYKGKRAALKKVKYEHLIDAGKTPEWIRQKFILEVALMSQLNSHTSFVPLIGACVEPPHLWMVLEYMPGGSLFNILHCDNSETWLSKMPSINAIATSISNGMQYIHTQQPQIIHRDLTSQNVLIDATGYPKIADFGISRFKLDIGDRTMTSIGNPRWRAPEVTKNQRYSEKVDVYGFALILYECFARSIPFGDCDSVPASHMAAQGKRPNIPDTCPPAWAQLITRCWDPVPADRPGFGAIISILEHLPIVYIPSRSKPVTFGNGKLRESQERTPYY
eukprot:TRINITY_DN12344_c0_g1_i1.p2 TRINITY_DN12344_c0_g1~~TRINITY_DN12344_c0_g1_i1.p2  ORF type:complete len:656 (-),score=105.63 TRINITY_DN12344_c0_g1_i1:96-2063(-)